MHVLRLFLLLISLLSLSGCQTSTTIVNNVSERDANEIIVLLASHGIQASKVSAPSTAVGGGTTVQMWDIQVPGANLTQAIAILNQAGFPRVKGTTLLDLFGSAGLVPSDLQDKIRYQEGLSEQLATTIRKMDGIIDANVQITFPQEEEAQKKPLTASVYIKHRGVLDNPNSLLITKIKRLVACSLPGLTVENVCVVADRAMYTDLGASTCGQRDDIRSYVTIWSIHVAKESAVLFQTVFYTFLILLFLFIAATLWLLWKFHHIIRSKGTKTLFQPEPYSTEIVPIPVEEPLPPQPGEPL